MFNVFFWIRTQVRQAVLAGVDDALRDLDAEDREDTSGALAALRSRMTALPAPVEEKVPTNGKRAKA